MSQSPLPSVALTISPTSDPEWRLFEGGTELPESYLSIIVYRLRNYGEKPVPNLTVDELNAWMGGDWSFTSPKGTLIKRFIAAVYKHTGSDPNNYAVTYLDQAINEERREKVYYRITDDLNWSYREYGDSSCFWGWGDTNRIILIAAQCYALQFRRALKTLKKDGTPNRGAGIGRCWVIPCDGGVGLTNFYGIPEEQQVRVFKAHLGVPVSTERIGVTASNGRGSVYRNGDGLFFWPADRPRPDGERRAFGPVCRCYHERIGNHESAKTASVCHNCMHGYDKQEATAEIEGSAVVAQ